MDISLFKSEYDKFKNSKKNEFLLFYSNFKEQIIFLSKICKESKGQTLITCSNISEIEVIKKILLKYIEKERIEIINKTISKTELLNRYKNINSNQAKVVISTRIGIFSPFSNLQNIIIINEESKDHKQYDQNPRYNIKEICRYVSNKHNIKLIFTSQSPSIETYYRNIEELNIKTKNTKTTINIIDQKTEKRSRNELFTSTKLQEKIEEYNNTSKKILIINNNLKSEFKSNQKIKEEIEKLTKEKIITIDSTKNIEKNDIKSAKIIIGTEFLVQNYLYNIENINSIALLSIDNLINATNIYANEELFVYITKFINFCAEQNIENLLIQTKNVENETLNLAINQDYVSFYKKEIRIRKELEFQPFWTIIDIIIKEKNKDLVNSQSNEISKILNKNKIEILGETETIKELKTKTNTQNIITIRIQTEQLEQNKLVLEEISKIAIIDIK